MSDTPSDQVPDSVSTEALFAALGRGFPDSTALQTFHFGDTSRHEGLDDLVVLLTLIFSQGGARPGPSVVQTIGAIAYISFLFSLMMIARGWSVTTSKLSRKAIMAAYYALFLGAFIAVYGEAWRSPTHVYFVTLCPGTDGVILALPDGLHFVSCDWATVLPSKCTVNHIIALPFGSVQSVAAADSIILVAPSRGGLFGQPDLPQHARCRWHLWLPRAW